MKKVEGLYEDKPTYFVGKLIVNGCKSFTIDKIDEIRMDFEFDVEKVKDIYFNQHDENEDLNNLVNDEDVRVRIAVAKQGFGLGKLINDEEWMVRRTVARQGFGLDVLINDENREVRMVASEKLKINR